MSRATPFCESGSVVSGCVESVVGQLRGDKYVVVGIRKRSLLWNSPGLCLDNNKQRLRGPSAAILSPHCRDCGWTSADRRKPVFPDQKFCQEQSPRQLDPVLSVFAAFKASRNKVADVYSVSDPIHAENSGMYTASGENEEDGNSTGNIEKEQQNTENIMQADSTVNDECDMEPYAVADMSDHETYLNATTNVRQQASKTDSKVNGDGDMEPVTDMSDHETYFSRTTNIDQQASDDSSHDTTKNDGPMQEVNNLTTPNATELTSTTITTIKSADSTDPPSFGGISGTTSPSLGGINGTTSPSLGGINGTTPPSLGGINGTSSPSIGGINGTTSPSLGGINGTTPPSIGGINGTSSPSIGGINGTSPPSIGGINGTKPHAFGSINGTRPPIGTNPPRQKEVKKNVTFGGKGKRPGQFNYVMGLAVSSTNEIFVCDMQNKRIQVFSVKGGFLRSFPTGNMHPTAITRGRNDTLWVTSYLRRWHDYGHAIQQYSKEGRVLTKFKCSDTELRSIAWHKLSGRIILSLYKRSAHFSTAAWFSPSYTQTEATPRLTCDMAGFGSTGSDHVTVDKKGNIFIADDRKKHGIVEKYDKKGVYLSSFGSRGTGAGNLNFPRGICVDSLGRVIVADYGNSRVEMFTAEGKHIRTVAYITQPQYVATGGEGQLVVSHQHGFITIFPKY
ncbi:hypothetical protein Bbelb_342790 [Branchiostoma belcheri]|nr:hypothetical protein Bbelb_342790 [Branchiostoma belcheri]